MLPGLDGPTAHHRLETALDRCRAEVRIGGLPVTFSAGVAAVEPGAGPSALADAEAAARLATRSLKDYDGRGSVVLDLGVSGSASASRTAPGQAGPASLVLRVLE